MAVTDELRKWSANRFGEWTSFDKKHIEAIADRIDEEHKREVVKGLNEWKHGRDEAWDEAMEMLEREYVQLPKDVDGVPIRVGDFMAYKDNTKPVKVVAIAPPAVFLTDEGPRYSDMCRHYHAPTIEDVLRELADEVYADTANEIRDRDSICAKYAKRLQLKEVDG